MKQREIRKEINELSATLVPVLNGIAILPLIGSIDEDRAKQLLDEVPFKVQEQDINCLIIDFTGIYTLNSVVIDYLFNINSVLSIAWCTFDYYRVKTRVGSYGYTVRL